MKNKLYISFSILFCIATLFMSVGYAAINSVSLNVSGEMIAQAQKGIFITEVNYNGNLSNNVLVTDSKINSSHQTNLDSSIVLSNDANSQISYDITIYNSNDLAYVFNGVEYTLGENTYSNKNIIFKLTGLSDGDVVNSKDDITFSITFYYDDSSNISNVNLNSILHFKFSIVPILVGEYSYTGNYETFTVPYDGIYKIELWGAQGGPSSTVSTNPGGTGAYTSGKISLTKDTKLYVYVGNFGYKPDNLSKPFNGGGAPDITGIASYSHDGSYSGGGATDVRIVAGEWDNFTSLKSRIMVASGGAGGNNGDGTLGGYGGGLLGLSFDTKGLVSIASQTQGNAFGIGQSSGVYPNTYVGSNGVIYAVGADTGAGGGGYYGGYRGYNHDSGGSGGTSFISGHNGCDAILESSTENNIIHTGQSIHYSGYMFTDTVMIDGEGYNWTMEKGELIGMPTYDGTGSMLGNTGDGYAKITFVKEQ